MVERTGRGATRRASGAAGGASPPPGASPRARARRVASPPPAAASPRGASPKPSRRAAPPAASPSPPPAASPKAAKGTPKAASPKPAAKKPAPAAAPHAAAHAHYEFGGPLGAGAITLGLPSVCYALVRVCNPLGCMSLRDLPALPPAPPARAYVSLAGFAAYLGWLALCVALHVILPGARKEGTLLRDGTRLTYKLNGAPPDDARLLAARTHGGRRPPRVLHSRSADALPACARAGMRVFAAIAALTVGLTYAGLLDLSWVHDNFLVRFARVAHACRSHR
jgi:hypothetical protein